MRANTTRATTTRPPVAPAGYSGTPLPNKLGIKPGHAVVLFGAPPDYFTLLGELPPDVHFHEGGSRTAPPAKADVVHFFTASRSPLATALPRLGKLIHPDGAIWISWPKKSSGVPCDFTEDTIRELCLPLGLVDIKVCAIDATWSGLKLVWRKERR